VVERSAARFWWLFLTGVLGCASTAAGGEGMSNPASSRRLSGYSVHEATDAEESDGRIDVQQDHGFISQEAAQDAVMGRWPALRGCYREAGAATSFAGGPVTLRFLVDPSGATSEVQVAESRLGNYEVERCLQTASRTITFPRPRGGAPASVDYTLDFQPTGEVAVIDVPDDASLTALVGQQVGARCQALGGDEVFATLYVDATGAVRSAGLASPASLDGTAADCLATALRKARVLLPAVHGHSLGRVKVALRATDLVAHSNPATTRSRSGRRSVRR
jgi:TonB family protein